MNRDVQSHSRPAPSSRRRAASAAAWPTDSDARHDSRADAEREHTPHLPGAAVCLCAACHLKLSRFPRRQDGRIMLPDPLAARSEVAAVGRSFHPQARVRTRSNAHVDGGRAQEDRRVLETRDRWDNRGEGPSTAGGNYGLSRPGIPVNVLDGRPHQLDVLQEFGASSRGDQLPHAPAATLGATRNRQGSITDRTRPRRVSKPYDSKPNMGLDFQGSSTVSQQYDAAPRHPGKVYPGKSRSLLMGLHQQQHLSTAYEDVTSHQSAASLGEALCIALTGVLGYSAAREVTARLEARPIQPPWGESVFSEHANPSLLGLQETNTATSSSFSHGRPRSESYHNMVSNPKSKAPRSSANLGSSRPSSSHTSQYNHPSLAPPQPYQQTPTNLYFTDAAGGDPPPPKVIRFKSHPRNPQPEVWTHNNNNHNTQAANDTKNPGTPPDMGHYEGPGESSSSSSSIGTYRNGVLPTGLTGPAGEGRSSQAGPSSVSQQRQHYPPPPPQQQEYQYQAHHLSQAPAPPLQFQSPVTPQIHVANTERAAVGKPRALSVVHVKWDSERKRRQGYFAAQDDGEEKSPFRHYNKTGCDYDD
ncbi:hypothetical protein BJ912DRAFT_1058406 [Pholiota molesta]|nr:hypothetical protein BJ912DRAFT_1058406 [Pholiota molesta]